MNTPDIKVPELVFTPAPRHSRFDWIGGGGTYAIRIDHSDPSNTVFIALALSAVFDSGTEVGREQTISEAIAACQRDYEKVMREFYASHPEFTNAQQEPAAL